MNIPVNYSQPSFEDDTVVPVYANSTPQAFNGGLNNWQKAWGGVSQMFGGTDLNGTPGVQNYTPTNGNSRGNMSSFDKINAGLQTLGSALAAFNGYKANKLAKQQLAFQKDAFNRQFTAQKNITNSQFSERQARRVNEAAANGYAAPTSVADYMDKYGVK